MKEQFEKIIYNWVKQNFGESEADDPVINKFFKLFFHIVSFIVVLATLPLGLF